MVIQNRRVNPEFQVYNSVDRTKLMEIKKSNVLLNSLVLNLVFHDRSSQSNGKICEN